MTRILMHIGAPKTGTTAIQGFLARHEDALRNLGVNYTQTERPHIAHNPLPRTLKNGGGAGYIDRLQAEIARSDAALHVISSEMLFRLPIARMNAAAFAQHLPAEMRAQTRVVAYVRRHDRYIEALYKQLVKNGKTAPDPAAFVAQQMAEQNFAEVLDTYAEAFGKDNVIVRPFERSAFPGGDVVQDFVQLLDVPQVAQMDTVAPDQTNRTLSVEVSEILGQISRNTPLNVRQLIRDIIAQNAPGAFASNDVFDRDTQTRIVQHFEADDAALCAWTGKKDGPFFDRSDLETPPPAPRTAADIAQTWREANGIVARAMAKQIKA